MSKITCPHCKNPLIIRTTCASCSRDVQGENPPFLFLIATGILVLGFILGTIIKL